MIRKLLPLLIILLIPTASAVQICVSTIPKTPRVGSFIVKITVLSNGRVENANLMTFGLISKSLSLGDFTGEASVELRAHADRPGMYRLRVLLTYSELVNGTLVSGYSETVKVLKVVESPRFRVLSLSGFVRPGEVGRVDVKVLNEGCSLFDVYVRLKGFTSLNPVRFYRAWRSGVVKRISYSVYANDSLRVGTYKAYLLISGRDGMGDFYSLKLPISVRVVGSPRLIISSFKTIPRKVYPCSNFTLKIGVENVGKAEAKDVRVTLSLPKCVKGESLKYLGVVRRGREKFAAFELNVSYVQGEIPIGVKISSEEGSWNYTVPLYISPFGAIRVCIAGVYTIPQRIVEGDTFTLNIAVENCGKVEVKAVKILLILPDGFKGRNSYFVGTLKSGDTATSTFVLKAGKAGIYKIPVVITYLDPALKVHREREYFTIYVFRSKSFYMYLIAIPIVIAVIYAVKRFRGGRDQ